MPLHTPGVRAAEATDARAIRDLVRATRLNPLDLDWRRFLVATEEGAVVACAQVRVHRAGTRELASVAVAPACQGRGVGRAIAEAAIGREPVRPLFLYTETRTVGFWEKLGFRPIEDAVIPRDLGRSLRIGRLVVAAFSFVTRTPHSLVVMRRDEA